VPTGAMPDTIALGPVRNTAQVWINGVPLSAPAAGRGGAGGGGRGAAAPGGAPPAPVLNLAALARATDLTLPIPAGVLKAGANTITVRVNNTQAEGGFVGAVPNMFLAAGERHTSIAGPWKYRVERSANTGALYAKPGELAAHLAFTAAGGPASAAAAALPTVAAVPDVTIQLAVVPNEMKFAETQLNVQTGQMVELVFVNADQMQHNFVLGAQGSLQMIGAASDQMATQPNAAAVSYVPDIPQILFKTPLVNAGQTVRVQFRAPAEAGQYPYICTFPAHWRLMNGILNVTAPPGRGGGAGRGAAGGAGAAGAGGRAGAPAAPPAGGAAPGTAPAPAAPAGGRGQ